MGNKCDARYMTTVEVGIYFSRECFVPKNNNCGFYVRTQFDTILYHSSAALLTQSHGEPGLHGKEKRTNIPYVR